ncbi:MAG: hypothetical protein ACRYFX_02375 [Janthinobacterium lividum]
MHYIHAMRPTTIHQPAPCHESWEAMTPTDVGRHCAACQTQVVDFTQMTDGEVVAFVSQYNPVRRCGRFREDQVDRPLLAAARPVTGWRRWAVATVLLAGSAVGLKARAQGRKPDVAVDPTTRSIASDSFLVRGVVRNWWGIRKKGVFVYVHVKCATSGGWAGTTDAKGRFRITVPKNAFDQIRYLKLTYGIHPGCHLTGEVPFDSTRTRPYHIRMDREAIRNPGFF